MSIPQINPGLYGTSLALLSIQRFEHAILSVFHLQVQGGDPTGTGGGGGSYWGTPFRDEYDLKGAEKHSERGMLSMANKGLNTNGYVDGTYLCSTSVQALFTSKIGHSFSSHSVPPPTLTASIRYSASWLGEKMSLPLSKECRWSQRQKSPQNRFSLPR